MYTYFWISSHRFIKRMYFVELFTRPKSDHVYDVHNVSENIGDLKECPGVFVPEGNSKDRSPRIVRISGRHNQLP